MTTPDQRLAERYARIEAQLVDLFASNRDPVARMATMAALLHHKMPHYFWTGFYRLLDDKLVVGPYQGPLACAILDGPDGVCWAAVQGGEAIIVPDVHAFPGHVACDSRSQSELVVPVRDHTGDITAVLDIDSDAPDAFTTTDAAALTRLAALIHP
jgi:L-methionine (R)-S-oxide reductase